MCSAVLDSHAAARAVLFRSVWFAESAASTETWSQQFASPHPFQLTPLEFVDRGPVDRLRNRDAVITNRPRLRSTQADSIGDTANSPHTYLGKRERHPYRLFLPHPAHGNTPTDPRNSSELWLDDTPSTRRRALDSSRSITTRQSVYSYSSGGPEIYRYDHSAHTVWPTRPLTAPENQFSPAYDPGLRNSRSEEFVGRYGVLTDLIPSCRPRVPNSVPYPQRVRRWYRSAAIDYLSTTGTYRTHDSSEIAA